ncbi:MAG: transglutaminase-like domain-containing protein [Acidimicrobiia bacterium]|nr:transglutaminase-like domain-containing protein [Acidimicrobiia bacterium]
MTTPAERLTELLSAGEPVLDRVMAVIASIAPDAPTEDDVVGELDQLAEGLEHDAPAGKVMRYAYGQLGFVGNVANYYNPANSLIHRVLRDRRGIPLTLAAVGVELARRSGTELSIVGLPGHVVVGEGGNPTRWFDPFAGGAELDLDDCRRLFARFSPIEQFSPDMLSPIDQRTTTVRMLNNLKVSYRSLGDLSQIAKVLELAVSVPGSPVSERHELASVLAALGRDERAIEQRELLADLDPGRAANHRLAARHHRARRN